MKIKCLIKENGRAPRLILETFMRSVAATFKYGKAVIYSGEEFYLPYYLFTYKVAETGEEYRFLHSGISEDICVYKDSNEIILKEMECEDERILFFEKSQEYSSDAVKRKMQMNRKMRKVINRMHLEEIEAQQIYIPEQTFYVKCKTLRLFLVDFLQEKVDFIHLGKVEERFAGNYVREMGKKGSTLI